MIRSRERQVLKSTVFAVLSKFAAAGFILVTTPLILHTLGDDRFGIWIALGSVALFFAAADFGLGSAVINAVSDASGRGLPEAAAGQITAALACLCAIALVLAAIFFSIDYFFAWGRFFNIPAALEEEASAALALLVLAHCIQLPLSLTYRILEGNQRAYVSSAWQLIGTVGSLIATWIVTSTVPTLKWYVVALVAPAVACNLLCSAHLLATSQFRVIGKITTQSVSMLMKAGSLFFSLNVLTWAAMHSDSLVISMVHGPAGLVEFGLVQKMAAVAFVFQSFITALVPAYGHARAQGQSEWIRRTFWNSLWIGLVFSFIIALILLLAGSQFAAWWTRGAVNPSRELYFAFAVFMLLLVPVGVISALFNSGWRLLSQLRLLLAVAPICVITKILMVQVIGPVGTLVATVVIYSLIFVLPAFRLINSEFNSEQSGSKPEANLRASA